MITLKTVIASILLAAFCLDAQSAQLAMEIESKGSMQGHIVVGFYVEKNKANYPKKGKADITCRSQGISGTGPTILTCVLPPGVYAAAFFHDENGNGELDSGLLGPTEPYGFSNNAFGFMGKAPPEFSEASFTVGDGDNNSLVIKLK